MRLRMIASVAAVILIAAVAGLMTYFPLLRSESTDPRILILDPTDPDPDLRPLVTLPDLSKVDRRVIEPAGLTNPRFCLLVFGPEANTRVWLVEDGETLYIDRNANGDLTDPGEAVLPSERREFMGVEVGGIGEVPHRGWTYSVGDLAPGDGSERHTDLKVVRSQSGDKPSEYVVSVRVRGVMEQYARWRPIVDASRETAPVIHFGGAVVPKPISTPALHRGRRYDELRLCIGTPGLGDNSFAYVVYEAVPKTIRPVVTIAWPTNGPALTERFALARRC